MGTRTPTRVPAPLCIHPRPYGWGAAVRMGECVVGRKQQERTKGACKLHQAKPPGFIGRECDEKGRGRPQGAPPSIRSTPALTMRTRDRMRGIELQGAIIWNAAYMF